MSDDDKPWDVRILERMPPHVDVAAIEENLRLTPTQRVQKLQATLARLEAERSRCPTCGR